MIENMLRGKNTKTEGFIEFFIYKEKDSYVGVCLTFDILEEGAHPELLMKSLEEAALLHLETVRKHKLSDTLLNRHAPKMYWEKYENIVAALKKKPRSSPFALQVSPYLNGKICLVV